MAKKKSEKAVSIEPIEEKAGVVENSGHDQADIDTHGDLTVANVETPHVTATEAAEIFGVPIDDTQKAPKKCAVCGKLVVVAYATIDDKVTGEKLHICSPACLQKKSRRMASLKK